MSLEKAYDWVVRLLSREMGTCHSVSSLAEAKVNLDGGVGLPYKYHGYTYKEDWLACNGDFECHLDYSRSDYSGMWDCFPKVEILKEAKANDKTRIICGAPVEHYLVGAMLYTSFNESLNKCSFKTKSALSLKMCYRGVSELWSYLPEFCENSDATRFDKTVSPKLLKYVYMIRRRLMKLNDKEHRMHEWYFNNLIFRRSYLASGDVYNIFGGNGSGQYNTTSDNTIAHIFALAYAHVRCGHSFREFCNARQLVYGDDYIGEPMKPEFWNFFCELGFNIKKTPIQNKYLCDFLSTNFASTAYGVCGIPKTLKGIYSAYTSEKKHWRSVRIEKLYSLWLLYFFHRCGYVFSLALSNLGVEVNNLDAIQYHFGFCGGGGFKTVK